MIIMLIDDDQEDRHLLSEALHDLNPETICTNAANGAEALILLNDMSFLPDYIFLDMNMPVMNGKEFLKKIKTDEKFRHIPVVIYSAISCISDIEEMGTFGASCFLTKPTCMNEMRLAIQQALGYETIHDYACINKQPILKLKISNGYEE
jgi:CheY-like chemotaxis protein